MEISNSFDKSWNVEVDNFLFIGEQIEQKIRSYLDSKLKFYNGVKYEIEDSVFTVASWWKHRR